MKAGEPSAIQELWESKQYTFMAIDFEWSERNKSSCLEFGYATLRSFYLNTMKSVWPANPTENYRRGHFVVEEYVNVPQRKRTPVVPWEYVWGESHVIPKARLGEIVQSIFSNFASPDSETAANDLILVAHGISGDLERLADLKIKVPRNCICIDTAVFERQMFATGLRGAMVDQGGKTRPKGTTLSLEKVIQSFGYGVPCTLHNAGNDAFMCLWVLQMLLDGPEKVKLPIPQRAVTVPAPPFRRPPMLRSHTSSSLDRVRKEVKALSLFGLANGVPSVASLTELDEHGVLQSSKSHSAVGTSSSSRTRVRA